MLKLYVDSAVREDVERWLATGTVHGVTTNPTLLQRAGLRMADLPEVYRWATAAGAREVFFQAWGQTAAEILECGRRLRAIGPQVVVKVPASREGVTATAALSGEGCPTLLTAVYNASQALLAQAAGARYIAPYLGRMGDAGRDGHEEVVAMQEALDGVGGDTEILLASIRSISQVLELSRHGVSAYAVNPAVLDELFADELTAQAVATFEQAAREIA